ncbi:MAG: helix-turn-helix domain-containing protein [Ilumatobacter sp.]|uniref:winged helix-turn-helix transcriptional regulator n=1 Tax=Ilumatobacter sp. TaxID=1967498 RepID=UPI002622BC11|nr:helix-turn-helix domain-containing protein [Ilumatobacter sp.]MDJ0769276.1 helix-turn-helix domain-containing protein [Ilumatobacter sp.]
METYGQYCPIARTAEILAERWTPLVVRNLLFGATTFTAIANGVPTMSRSVLSSRLRSLERRGVIVRASSGSGARRYLLTEAGYDLATTIAAMAEWGERWLDVTSDHHDPVFALWAWSHVQAAACELPTTRTIVEFEFTEEPPARRRWWLLVQRPTTDMCDHDPGGDERAWVRARSGPFCDWHRGALSWAAARRSGAIEVTGPRELVRGLPRWNTHAPTMPPRSEVCA